MTEQTWTCEECLHLNPVATGECETCGLTVELYGLREADALWDASLWPGHTDDD